MQGKERNKELIDQQFTDQAWADMASLLDQEMPISAAPVSDNKNRYGLLLLVLLIGFASGIGTMFLFQQNKVQDNIEPSKVHFNPKEVAKVESQNEIAQAPLSKAETDQLAQISTVNNTIEQKIKNNFSNQTAPPAAQSNQSVHDQKLYNNSSSVVVFNQIPQLRLNTPNGTQLNHKNNKNFGNGISEAVPHTESGRLKNQSQQNNPVGFLATRELPLLSLAQPSAKMNLVSLDKKNPLTYGFYLGTHTRNFKGMHGLSTGLYASYQLDSRFSVRTGLGYSIIAGFQLKSPGIADPLTPEFFEPIETNIQEYSTVSSLGSNQDLPVQSLHYVDLPAALDYRMSENLSILMGMKLSYLVDTKTDGYFSQHLSSNDAELLDEAMYNSMRKVDVATVLGVGFYPTSRVGVELKYNHGLVDYTKDEKWHVRQLNTNKTFELNLNYFLR